MVRSITSFRAYCFLAVFFFHCSELHLPPGYLGVQAFFVLSGFLLTPILVDMKNALPLKLYLINFYGRRGLRIFPLYYLYLILVTFICLTLVSVKIELTDITNFLSSLPWSYTYAYNFYHATDSFEHSKLVTHFWSLAVEEQFYLFWPLFIWVVRSAHLKWFLFAVAAIGALSRFIIENAHTTDMFSFLHDRIDLVIYVLPFSHFDAFAIGGLFALYGKSIHKNFSWLAIFAVVAFGLLTHYIATNKISVESLGYPAFMDTKYVLGYTVINVFFAFMIMQIKNGAFASALFDNRVAYYFGNISYGLYVFHYPCLWFVPVVMPDHDLRFVNELLAFLLTTLIASISYHFFESKANNFKDLYFPTKIKPARETVHRLNS